MPSIKPTHESMRPGTDQAVSSRLKIAREDRAFTQGALANRTKVVDPEEKGISRTAIIGYEQGASKPGLREIKLLCDVLRVTPNWLIYGTESAGVSAQPSLELLLSTPKINPLDGVMRTAIALTALKGHECDALQSLILSLAGRQLGDMRLSALLLTSSLLQDAFRAALKGYWPDVEKASSLEEIAEYLSQDLHTNAGNKFRLGEEGEILNEEAALYPDPKPNKFGNSTNS